MFQRGAKRINGWVILDKPVGISSSKAVALTRRLFDAKKGGHGGTLDPLASGVLPIALGEATKTVGYVIDSTKAYQFELQWGMETSTGDSEGEVTKETSILPTRKAILEILNSFIGEIFQIPPIYSAIKINGHRSYKLARLGKQVKHSARKVTVFKLSLVDSCAAKAKFEIICSKGTYIRSLARDLGLALGTYAYITRLRRVLAGPFTEADAFSLDSLEGLSHSGRIREALLSLETALDDIPALQVNGCQAERLRCGQSIKVFPQQSMGEVYVNFNGTPVGIARIVCGRVEPVRIFNI